MNLYKKSIIEPYSFLVFHTTLSSDNSLRFRKNLLETIYKLIITIDDKIKVEKLQFLETTSGKVDKYEYFTGEEILPSDQSRILEQAKFIYSPRLKIKEKNK